MPYPEKYRNRKNESSCEWLKSKIEYDKECQILEVVEGRKFKIELRIQFKSPKLGWINEYVASFKEYENIPLFSICLS